MSRDMPHQLSRLGCIYICSSVAVGDDSELQQVWKRISAAAPVKKAVDVMQAKEIKGNKMGVESLILRLHRNK
jgi:hypothetical protein